MVVTFEGELIRVSIDVLFCFDAEFEASTEEIGVTQAQAKIVLTA